MANLLILFAIGIIASAVCEIAIRRWPTARSPMRWLLSLTLCLLFTLALMWSLSISMRVETVLTSGAIVYLACNACYQLIIKPVVRAPRTR